MKLGKPLFLAAFGLCHLAKFRAMGQAVPAMVALPSHDMLGCDAAKINHVADVFC